MASIPTINNQKICVFGLQGTGKTHYSREIVKRNDFKSVLVYSPHRHDFLNEDDRFIFYKFNDFVKDFEDFCIYARELGKKKLIDGVIIDEADLIFRNNYDLKQNSTDVFINHRHYNIFLMLISRRPQDIPAKIVESSKFIICFALQGANVKNKFNNIFKGFGDLVLTLDFESHEYIFKEIGKPPEKMQKL